MRQITYALTVMSAVLLLPSKTWCDEVDRSTSGNKNSPHIIVTCKVDRVIHLEPDGKGGEWLLGKATVLETHESVKTERLAPGQKVEFYFRGGLNQRPKLPVIKVGDEIKAYMREIERQGKQVLLIEFDDDVLVKTSP
jgi:hypothetical protein